MCQIIVINRGEKEIATPGQFKEHFGFLPEKYDNKDVLDAGCCLCMCDIEKTFKKNNIQFKTDAGDYFVGQLDQVKGDLD